MKKLLINSPTQEPIALSNINPHRNTQGIRIKIHHSALWFNIFKIQLFLIAIGIQSAHAQNEEIVSFNGDWKGNTIELRAELNIPKSSNPVPLIIVQHSSGPNIKLKSFYGFTDSISIAVGSAALDKGYAIIYTDIFSPRNIKKDNSGDIGVGTSVALKDIRSLMDEISKDPRIDKKNIFLFGHSYGGGVSLHAAFDSNKKNRRYFNAIVSSAPGCQLEREGKIKTPTLLIIGDKDDWTSPAACIKLTNNLKARGDLIEIKIIENANHSYSIGGDWQWNRQSRTGCGESLVKRSKDGELTKDGRIIEKNQLKKECIKQGATAGGNNEKLPSLVNDTLSFIESRIIR